MSRRTEPLVCSKNDIIALQKVAEDNSNPRIAKRAKLVLACAKGDMIKDIAAMYSERPNTVLKWKRRFAESGIKGLCNAPRGKAKGVYGEVFAGRLVHLLETDPPAGETYWTGRLLAKELGAPYAAVCRYLRRENIRLLEYRRRVKGEVSSQETEENVKTPLVDSPASSSEGGAVSLRDDGEGNAVVTDTIVQEEDMCVHVTVRGQAQDNAAKTIHVHVQVKLMDGDTCILERNSSFPEALPHLEDINIQFSKA